MTVTEAVLLLSKVPRLSKAHLARLMERGISLPDFVQDPRAAGGGACPDLETNQFVQELEHVREETDLSKILEDCANAGIQILTCADSSYPLLLREIHSPPLILYVKGNLIPEDQAAIAVVGSRHASPYGTRTAHRISYELAEAGVTVISGLARGIDGEAHRGALEARGRTIAVLGSRLDIIYI